MGRVRKLLEQVAMESRRRCGHGDDGHVTSGGTGARFGFDVLKRACTHQRANAQETPTHERRCVLLLAVDQLPSKANSKGGKAAITRHSPVIARQRQGTATVGQHCPAYHECEHLSCEFPHCVVYSSVR